MKPESFTTTVERADAFPIGGRILIDARGVQRDYRIVEKIAGPDGVKVIVEPIFEAPAEE